MFFCWWLSNIQRHKNNHWSKNYLQKGLNSLQVWASDWNILFNANSCNILHISGSLLLSVEKFPDTKYLVIQTNSKFAFSIHISIVSTRSISNLAFLLRNLKSYLLKLRDTAYRSLRAVTESEMVYSRGL